jgi:caffeoyl-CoA O-methyltransferase
MTTAWHDGTVIVTPELDAYTGEHTTPEPSHLAALAAETREFSTAHNMMVGPVEGQFLALMVELSGARRVLEIGTFTGYSALSMAAALPPGGTLLTCDVNPDHVAVARRHIAASPYADRIEIRLGPALETLETLPGPFDLVFIDADKTNYANYYEAVLPKLAVGGLMLVDNVLWSGRVLGPDGPDTLDEESRAIRAFNDKVRDDPRVTCVMLTIRDGISVIRHRQGQDA